MVPAETLTDLVRSLISHPDITPSNVAKASGLHRRTVKDLADGKIAYVKSATSKKLTGLTVSQVLAETSYDTVGLPLMIQQIRSMQAQGWSLAWQAEKLGCHFNTLGVHLRGEAGRVPVTFTRMVDQLAREVDGKWGPSKRAALIATRLGWYPLAAYDSHGNLIPEAIEEDEEEIAAAKVMFVIKSLLEGHTVENVVEQSELGWNEVRKYRESAGLQLRRNNSVVTIWTFKDPDRAEQARRICDRYEWDGWTARESLAEMGVQVAAPKRRVA